MIGFDLTEEQQALQTLAREFVATHIKPVVLEREKVRDWRERAPWDIIEAGSKLGLRTVALPVEWGGMGVNYQTVCMLAEELAVGDCGISIIFGHGWRWSRAFPKIANKAQQEHFIPGFRDDHRAICAHPGTEPNRGGTQNSLRLGNELMESVARRDGDHWYITANKIFISNASMAKYLMMLVRTGKHEDFPNNITMFLVERASEGFKNGTIYSKLGSRMLINAEIILDNFKIPHFNLIGEEGHGFENSERGYGGTAPEIGATLLGTARAAYEECIPYVMSRVAGGTQIINHQAIQMHMADMYCDLEASRAIVQKAAWVVDNNVAELRPLIQASRIFAGEASLRVTNQALQIFGGAGIMENLPLEKYARDSLAFQHMHGTNDALKIKAARAIKALHS